MQNSPEQIKKAIESEPSEFISIIEDFKTENPELLDDKNEIKPAFLKAAQQLYNTLKQNPQNNPNEIKFLVYKLLMGKIENDPSRKNIKVSKMNPEDKYMLQARSILNRKDLTYEEKDQKAHEIINEEGWEIYNIEKDKQEGRDPVQKAA